MSFLSRFFVVVVPAFLLAWSGSARADVSSWLFLGGGPSWLSQEKSAYELQPTLQLDAGIGTPTSSPAVVGVLARTSTHFGMGTDLALALRATTGGFSRGDWGVALDAGAYKRWWGMESSGPLTSLHLGAPFGLQLSFNGALGTDDHRTFGVMFGVDFLRLTVHRLGGEQWWPNPRPAWRPEGP
jgi:hypothetical protein